MKHKSLLLFLTFLFSFAFIVNVLADSSLNADMIVALDGSGDFTKIQGAIDAAPSNSERRTVIYLKRGLYNTEKLIIPSNKQNITIIGESRDETIISYHIYDCPDGKCPVADAAQWAGDNIRTSATLTIQGNGFRAENLTIENTAGPVGQALAITVTGDKSVFINCNFFSYQDTIYLWTAGKRSYFENCLILGRTDYIYGAGIAFFQKCEIRSYGGGWITAPSTPLSQDYGYVFNECDLTYAENSPRAGDDGELIALGRPWHQYPHVVWMNSYMCPEINPVGWPTTWNMEYAATSADLKLYEYNNHGEGADMSGRADWVGIRELTAGEAQDYTVQKVLGGTDGWDPTAESSLVKTYTWTGTGEGDSWLIPENWNPIGIPAAGEIAIVDGNYEINADQGAFEGDLILKNGARLNVTGDVTTTYLSADNIIIKAANAATLHGKVATKGVVAFEITGTLTVEASITGVHRITKAGEGVLVLNANNSDFSGKWQINQGILEAHIAGALGNGNIEVTNGILHIGNNGAFQPTSSLNINTGGTVQLDTDITLTEFYIEGEMQPLGTYTASTHPDLIQGAGVIIIGRPSEFTFIGGANGNWDIPSNFSPPLLPEAGETVYVESEMETTSTVFAANIILNSDGRLRMRGDHASTGTVTMNTGSMISYATSGSGFSLDAPLAVLGDVVMQMSSSNEQGNALTLLGNIAGEGKITPYNNRNIECTATLVLKGNNSEFSGIWDLTRPSAVSTSVVSIEGLSPHAFGSGRIDVGAGNVVVFGHEQAVSETLELNLKDGGMAALNVDMTVEHLIFNEETMSEGVYTANTHPEWFKGEGTIVVTVGANEEPNPDEDPDEDTDPVTGISLPEKDKTPVYVVNNVLYVEGTHSEISLYLINGKVLTKGNTEKVISLHSLNRGIYFAKYSVDGKIGAIRFIVE